MGPDRWRMSRRALACALAVVVVHLATRCDGEARRCARAIVAHDWAQAYPSCEGDYRAGGDLARAIDAARAAYYLQRPDDTLRLASLGLIGPTAANAHQLIGFAQFARDQVESSTSHLYAAIALHALLGDYAAVSREFQQLSGLAWQHGNYQRALTAEAAGRDAALRAGDDRMITLLEIARADILRQVGDLRTAEASVERALAASVNEPADQALALLKRGSLHIDQEHFALARDPLTRALALEHAARWPRARMLEAMHLELAYVERKAGAFDRALVEMQRAALDGTDPTTYYLNRGLVLADMGWLAQASADLELAEAGQLEGVWAWWAPFQRAQIAARMGNVAMAITEDRKAIEQVARIAAQSGLFGSTMIANHRGPYLHLIGVLAAAARWNEVLDVIAAMDSQSLLQSAAAATDVAPPEPGPRLALAGPAGHGTAEIAVAAWRGRRLIILVPGGDRVWRIDIRDGQVTGVDVGELGALSVLARRLETDATDIAAGRALGDAMLPPLLDGEQLAVLAVGPIARAPLAGLRIADAPAIAHHALVRVPGILPRTPVAVGGAPPRVLGNPTGDLPAAADEARRVSAQLGATLYLGAQATRAALRAGAGASLLHVAGHTSQRFEGAALELADGPFAAAELARLAPAPRWVVLASCGASAGRDDAGNGSIANALLDAGAELVVGTRWSVDDADAARFIRAFYAAGGARDPLRALTAVQLDASLAISPITRAAFEISLGRPPG